MRKTCKFLLVMWCCCGSTTTLAFLTLTSIVARRRRLSPSCVFGTIGNEDFATIFGSQEAAERKTRDLARDYHPRPTTNTTDSGGGRKEESRTGNNKHKKQQLLESEAKKDEDSVARKTKQTSRVVGKYVPPPGLSKK